MDKKNIKQRQKIVVANHYQIYPAVTGGEQGIYYLYSNLAKWFDIYIVTYTYPGRRERTIEIANHLWERRIPKSKKHVEKEKKLSEIAKINGSDNTIIEHFELSQEYLKGLEEEAKDAEVIISDHPYIYNAIKEACPNKRVWYHANNVEYFYKMLELESSPLKDELLSEIWKIEKECCENSEVIFTVSEEDKCKFNKLYGIDLEKIYNISVGCDITKTKYSAFNNRKDLKKQYGYDDKLMAIFMGSSGKPNEAAVEEIINVAKDIEAVDFIIIGSIGNRFIKKELPQNIKVTGLITEKEKQELLSCADLALNPIEYGSGVNIKMFEYLATGIPVISTRFGIRGINVENNKQVIISSIDNLKNAIIDYFKLSDTIKEQISLNARKFIEEEGTWKKVAERLVNIIKEKKLIKVFEIDNCNENNNFEISYKNDVKIIEEKIRNRKVYIWGAGSSGVNLYRILKRNCIEVTGIIDSDEKKQNDNFFDKKIYSPQILLNSKENSFVIIASMFSYEIEEQLNKMNYKHESDYYEQELEFPELFLV